MLSALLVISFILFPLQYQIYIAIHFNAMLKGFTAGLLDHLQIQSISLYLAQDAKLHCSLVLFLLFSSLRASEQIVLSNHLDMTSLLNPHRSCFVGCWLKPSELCLTLLP